MLAVIAQARAQIARKAPAFSVSCLYRAGTESAFAHARCRGRFSTLGSVKGSTLDGKGSMSNATSIVSACTDTGIIRIIVPGDQWAGANVYYRTLNDASRYGYRWVSMIDGITEQMIHWWHAGQGQRSF